MCVSVRLNKIIQRKYNGKIQTIIHERELCEEEKFSSIYEKKKDRERKKIEIISCYYFTKYSKNLGMNICILLLRTTLLAPWHVYWYGSFFLQKSFDKSIMVEVGKNSSTHLSKKLWFKAGGLFFTNSEYIAGYFFF